jgi:hypothetical protein
MIQTHRLLDVDRLEEQARLLHTSVYLRITSHTHRTHDKRRLPHVEYRPLRTSPSHKLDMAADSINNLHSYPQEASLKHRIHTIGHTKRKRNTDLSSSSNPVSAGTLKGVTDKEGMANRTKAREEPDEECESWL